MMDLNSLKLYINTLKYPETHSDLLSDYFILN